MKFCKQVFTIPMHRHTKNKSCPHHEFKEKRKLVVGDDGHFLENVHWIELKLAKVVLHDVMHSLSKFQEDPICVL